MTVDDEVDSQLDEHLGPDVARYLQQWAFVNGRSLRVPSAAWATSGYSGCVVVPIIWKEMGQPPVYCVAKVCPESHFAEAAKHRKALTSSPRPFADDHLVQLPADTVVLPSGGAVLFQRLAGDGPGYVPASRLSDEAMLNFCRTVPSSLVRDWNPDRDYMRMPIRELLDVEARDSLAGRDPVEQWAPGAGLLGPTAGWISIDGSSALPNPLLFLEKHQMVGETNLDVLVGRSHSDLHLENVLWREAPSAIARSKFYLIDMYTFREQAPLVRDQINLMLAVVAHQWEDLNDIARSQLLDHMTSLATVNRVPGDRPLLFKMLREMYVQPFPRTERAGWPDWWKQYLVAMQATALRFTSYVALGPAARWWYFHLAARSAAALLDVLKIDVRIDRPVAVANPFLAAPLPARPQPASAARELDDVPSPGGGVAVAVPVAQSTSTEPTEWCGGAEVMVEGRTYMLDNYQRDTSESDDRSTGWREARAVRLMPDARGRGEHVWVRQVEVRPGPPPPSRRPLDALSAERRLLDRIGRAKGLPEVRGFETESHMATLVLGWPSSRDGRRPCDSLAAVVIPPVDDPWSLDNLLSGLAGVARTLGHLHRHGVAHRHLMPAGLLQLDDRRFALRDLGLAAHVPVPGEGPDEYRAPEQRQRERVPPGPATDTYQLAAIAYHLVVGTPPPVAVRPAPVAGLAEAITAQAGRIIDAALAPDPGSRPDVHVLAEALAAAV